MGWGGKSSCFLLCVVLVATILESSIIKCCVEEERLALLQIKAYMLHFSIDPKNDEQRWINSNSERNNCCLWNIVRCSPTTGRVTELHLSNMVTRLKDVSGLEFEKEVKKMPWVLNVTLFSPFSQLISLDLSYNYIGDLVQNDGSTKLSTLKNLQKLYLSRSNFASENGFLAVSALTSLRILDLSYSSFNASYVQVSKVICNLKNLRELYLQENYFYGNLSCLGNFTFLKHLDASANNFTGELPSFGNLTSLEYLDLSYNYFEGRFSLSSLASLSKLRYLHLSRNMLEVQTEDVLWQPTFQLYFLGLGNCSLNKPRGTFPKFLFYQYNLSGIDLSFNNLMDVFPTWLLYNNSHLGDLYLMNNRLTGKLQFPGFVNFSSVSGAFSISNNYFHGQLPRNFGYMFPNIEYLNMSGNNFEGHIPTSIGHMRELGILDLSRNNFSGELPRTLLNSDVLSFLALSDNSLEGEIVPNYMNLTSLSWLQLSNNRFSGTINEALLLSTTYLNYFDISKNKVTGQLPAWIGDFNRLGSFSVSNNFFKGQISSEICNLSSLNYLDLSQNNFTGTIPSCSNFNVLYYLHLQKNSLTGRIPNELSSFSYLESLDLRDNRLSDTIPLWIKNLTYLTFLLLSGNDLHGHIPKEICKLRYLNFLDLSRNKFSGEIPTCMGNMSFGLMSIDNYLNKAIDYQTIAEDFLLGFPTYPLDNEVNFLAKNHYLAYREGNLHLYSLLDLSCNNFTGVIPPELGGLIHIYSLNLSHNFLIGSIPENFSNLKQIESLDLSSNNLSGNIPTELVDLNFLEVFNVSYNNLTGKVPDTVQFSTFDQRSYLGNPGLCGSTMNKSCDPEREVPHPGPINEGGDGVLDMVEFFWSFSMSCVIMFLTTVVILYINSQWREALFEFVGRNILWWLPIRLCMN